MPAIPGGDRTEDTDESLSESVAWDIEYRNANGGRSAPPTPKQPHRSTAPTEASDDQKADEGGNEATPEGLSPSAKEPDQAAAAATESPYSDEVLDLFLSLFLSLCVSCRVANRVVSSMP